MVVGLVTDLFEEYLFEGYSDGEYDLRGDVGIVGGLWGWGIE